MQVAQPRSQSLLRGLLAGFRPRCSSGSGRLLGEGDGRGIDTRRSYKSDTSWQQMCASSIQEKLTATTRRLWHEVMQPDSLPLAAAPTAISPHAAGSIVRCSLPGHETGTGTDVSSSSLLLPTFLAPGPSCWGESLLEGRSTQHTKQMPVLDTDV